MKVYALTLGCKVNQYESDALLTLFAKHGYEITEDIQAVSYTHLKQAAKKSESQTRFGKDNRGNYEDQGDPTIYEKALNDGLRPLRLKQEGRSRETSSDR